MEKLHVPYVPAEWQNTDDQPTLVFRNGEPVTHVTPVNWDNGVVLVSCDKYGGTRPHYKDGRVYSTIECEHDLMCVKPFHKNVWFLEFRIIGDCTHVTPHEFTTLEYAQEYAREHVGVIATTGEMYKLAMSHYRTQQNA
jgi:hypothetical protein